MILLQVGELAMLLQLFTTMSITRLPGLPSMILRSNQVREGALLRDKALELIEEENKPRYESIKWYLDALDLDFSQVIEKVNKTAKLYRNT